jgi:hypothetical protein
LLCFSNPTDLYNQHLTAPASGHTSGLLDRRFALLTAGLDEPTSAYGSEGFVAPHSDSGAVSRGARRATVRNHAAHGRTPAEMAELSVGPATSWTSDASFSGFLLACPSPFSRRRRRSTLEALHSGSCGSAKPPQQSTVITPRSFEPLYSPVYDRLNGGHGDRAPPQLRDPLCQFGKTIRRLRHASALP